jgi:hypothetical protein
LNPVFVSNMNVDARSATREPPARIGAKKWPREGRRLGSERGHELQVEGVPERGLIVKLVTQSPF